MTQLPMDEVFAYARQLLVYGPILKDEFWQKIEEKFNAKFVSAGRMRITRAAGLVKVDKVGQLAPGANNPNGTHYMLWHLAKKQHKTRAFTDKKRLQTAYKLIKDAGTKGINRSIFWKEFADVDPLQRGSLLAQIKVVIRNDCYVLPALAPDIKVADTSHTEVHFNQPAVIIVKTDGGHELKVTNVTCIKMPTKQIDTIMADVDDD